jgi:hypothetical protein
MTPATATPEPVAPERCTVCGSSEGPMASATPTCWKAECIEKYTETMEKVK